MSLIDFRVLGQRETPLCDFFLWVSFVTEKRNVIINGSLFIFIQFIITSHSVGTRSRPINLIFYSIGMGYQMKKYCAW